MRNFFLFNILLLFSTLIYSQNKSELGIFAGASYYLGDVNPSKQFYMPGLAIGGLFRYNLNERYALKVSAIKGDLKANDLDFDNAFQQQRHWEFQTGLIELNLQLEFNFMPFSTNEMKTGFTPFVAAGAGYTFFQGADNSATIPFALGVKFSFVRRVTLTAEWGFRKTFSDVIDNLPNRGYNEYKSSFHNNDWYSIAGISLSYRLFDNKGDCPAYH